MRLQLNSLSSENALRYWKAPAQWRGREALRVKKGKRAIPGLRDLLDLRGNVASPARKDPRDQQGLKGKKAIQALRGLKAHRAKEASRVLKACRGLKERRAIPGFRGLLDRKGNVASLARKGLRDQQGLKGKKAIQALRGLKAHRAKGVNPALKGSRDPQGRREILRTPTVCKTLKTELPNWKRNSRRPASKRKGLNDEW